MPYDTLVTASVVHDIREMTGARVMKVYQPRALDIVLHLRKPGLERQLLLSAAPDSARVHFVSSGGENPKFPPMFCMILRKYLEGARLVTAVQPPFERLIALGFEGRNEMGVQQEYSLVAEIMGRRSNIVLLDGGLDGSPRILDALRRASLDENQAREVLPGRAYVPPPSRPRVAPDSLTAGMLASWLAEDPPVQPQSLLVDRVMGVGPALARHACAAAGPLDSGFPSRVVEALQSEFARTSWEPVVYFDGDRPLDHYCFPLCQYGSLRSKGYPSMSEALDEFYTMRLREERFRTLSQTLHGVVRKALEKAASRLNSQRRDLAEGMKAPEYKLYGELLTAYGAGIGRCSVEARVPNYYVDGSPEIVIPLDPSMNGRENAQAYYKKYAKAKSAMEQAGARVRRTEAEIEYLQQVEQTIEQAVAIEDLLEIREELAAEGYMSGARSTDGERHRRRGASGAGKSLAASPSPAPLTATTSGGCQILIGRNNRQNDALTRSARPDDIWLHAKQTPGAHVILRYPGDAGKPGESWPDEKSLLEAAQVAAFFSKGRANTRVPVDYTLVRHVWKPRGAKPGMVCYDHQKTIHAEPRMPASHDQS